MRLVSSVIVFGMIGCATTQTPSTCEGPFRIGLAVQDSTPATSGEVAPTTSGSPASDVAGVKYVLMLKDEYIERVFKWFLHEAKRAGDEITEDYLIRLRRAAVENAASWVCALVSPGLSDEGIKFELFPNIAVIVVRTDRRLDLREVESRVDVIVGQ